MCGIFKQTVKLNFAWVDDFFSCALRVKSRNLYIALEVCQYIEYDVVFKQQEENVSIHVAIFKEDLAFNWVLLNAKQTNFYTFKYFAKKRAKLKINTAQSWELNADQGVDRV